MARSSGERGWRNARAVAVTRAARLSGPTAVASKSAAPSTANEPDQTGSPGATDHRFGLAGEVGLVQGEPVSGNDDSVGDHLVARRQPHEVADDDPLDGQPPIDSVADDHCLGCDQRGKPVERPLGADLLEGADRDVRDQDPEEERVLPGLRRSSVSTPKTSRIPFGMVSVLARTMLA